MQQFTAYKQRLAQSLDTSEIRALLDADTSEPLLYAHIFPYLWPGEELEAEVGPLLCFDVVLPEEQEEQRPNLAHQLLLWLLCPHSRMDLDPSSAETRLDALAEEVDNLLSGSQQYGLGRLTLRAVEPLSLPPACCGKALTYQAASFR